MFTSKSAFVLKVAFLLAYKSVRFVPFFAYEAQYLRVSYREKQSFKIEGPRPRDPKRKYNASLKCEARLRAESF